MLDEHLVFAMVRHEVSRLDQIEHQLLLFLRRMSRRMVAGQRRIGYDVGTDLGQLVDDSGYGDTIARNRVGREQYRIARNNVQILVRTVGNPAEGCHRLTLGTGADDADAIGRQRIQIVSGDEIRILDLDEADLAADLENVFHRTTEDRNLAVAGDRCHQNLVETVDVGCEGRDEKSARRAAYLFHDRLGNAALGNREARDG